MSITIECNDIGILVHSIRKELRNLISREPWIKRSLRIVLLTHKRLLIMVDNVVGNRLAIKHIVEILNKYNIKYVLYTKTPLNM